MTCAPAPRYLGRCFAVGCPIDQADPPQFSRPDDAAIGLPASPQRILPSQRSGRAEFAASPDRTISSRYAERFPPAATSAPPSRSALGRRRRCVLGGRLRLCMADSRSRHLSIAKRTGIHALPEDALDIQRFGSIRHDDATENHRTGRIGAVGLWLRKRYSSSIQATLNFNREYAPARKISNPPSMPDREAESGPRERFVISSLIMNMPESQIGQTLNSFRMRPRRERTASWNVEDTRPGRSRMPSFSWSCCSCRRAPTR